MRRTVQRNGDMQLWDERPPVSTRHDRRTQDIGRFKAEIGLNTADKLTTVPQPVDTPLRPVRHTHTRRKRARLGPSRSRCLASSARPSLAVAIQAARSRSARDAAIPESIQLRTTSAMESPRATASCSRAAFRSSPISRIFSGDGILTSLLRACVIHMIYAAQHKTQVPSKTRPFHITAIACMTRPATPIRRLDTHGLQNRRRGRHGQRGP